MLFEAQTPVTPVQPSTVLLTAICLYLKGRLMAKSDQVFVWARSTIMHQCLRGPVLRRGAFGYSQTEGWDWGWAMEHLLIEDVGEHWCSSHKGFGSRF